MKKILKVLFCASTLLAFVNIVSINAFNKDDWEDARGGKKGLTNVDLQGAELQNRDLTNTVLTSAKLQDAKLQGADLSGTNLTGAIVTGADFKDVKGLTVEQKTYLKQNGAINVPN